MSITVTLPYPPSANRYWASRTIFPKGGGKPFTSTYVTSEAKQFKESVGWLLRAAGVRSVLPGRMHVDIKLYPHRPLDFKKRMRDHGDLWDDTVQRLDLDNCRKVVNDALKEIAIEDDKCIFKDSGEVMEPDGREACLIVTITPYVRTRIAQQELALPPAPAPRATPTEIAAAQASVSSYPDPF